jgi:hypothetical protein
VEWGGILLNLAVPAGIGLALALMSLGSPGLTIFLVALTGLVVVGMGIGHIQSQTHSYAQRLQLWQAYKQQYPGLRQVYEQQVEQQQQAHQHALEHHQRECDRLRAEAHSPQHVQAYRAERLRPLLQLTTPPDGCNTGARPGRYNSILKNLLSSYFPGKVHSGLCLLIPDYPYPYTPDIAYIDPNLNLHIDIEVDEPYVARSGKPHHCTGSDDRQNRFFLDRNWVVIRFSEEQVVRHTESCCKVVAQAIADITADPIVMARFSHAPDLPRRPQWTEAEARRMASNRARDRYHLSATRIC